MNVDRLIIQASGDFILKAGLKQCRIVIYIHQTKKKISVALVRKRTIPTERLPLVDEVSAKFCG
jgi:hypothetical protein